MDHVYSAYSESLLNYELAAPGTGIMSTIPGGGYAPLTGTSMATPLVSGALALYKQQKPDESKELIFGTLINTSTPNVDFLAAIETEPIPELAVLSSIQRDTINSQNGNGFLEPGETIEILPLIKNYWGPTDDVRVGIEFAEFEDTSKATIIQDEIQIGSISAYATLQDLFDTLKITISEGVANNVDIRFDVTAWSGPDQEYMSEPTEIVINVKNSVLLYGTYNTDLELTNNQEYLVSDNIIMYEDATLTIEPGTVIRVSDDKRITFLGNATMIAEGTKDENITWLAENLGWSGFAFGGGRSSIKYNMITGIWAYNVSGQSLFGTSGNFDVEKSIFTANRAYYFVNSGGAENQTIKTSQIYDNWFDSAAFYPGTDTDQDSANREGITQTNIINNFNRFGSIIYFVGSSLFLTPSEINIFANVYPNWYEGVGYYERNVYATNTGFILGMDYYVGTTNDDLINTYIHDAYNTNQSSNFIDRSTLAQIPHESAPGMVWKVEVNGFDAQDEYALLDPLGVGEHEFKVYFNRAMDTSVNPRVSYGVTIPYTQKIISETGAWSDDGKIYTVNHEIRVGAADGINRIRVQDAQDLDYFKIPVEDYRFNMLVQSAGSASAGWYATPGLGNIALTWEAPSTEEIDDALGYNMYRYQVDADGVESDPVKLNETLIVEDTDDSTTGVYYSDFDVVEGETYFYKYNILRTSFETTDFSSVVSSTPLTSTLGDSNGDFTVDVLDLVHDVDYILGNNPTPFIFLAGDVNADNAINVLDIVGTVDIILNPSDATDY